MSDSLIQNVGGGGGGGGGDVVVTASALPANAAEETGGNLATVATAQGVQGTGLNPPTGGTGILGFLSGIFNKISNALSVNIVPVSSVPAPVNPSMATATSVTLLAAGAYKMVEIQNNSAGNIMISLTGAALTGIVPSSSNPGILLTPGQEWYSPATWTSSDPITGYQASGGTISSVSVVSA